MSSKRRRRAGTQRGFTLIEVIVMAAVASVGILATLVVANTTLQTSDTNERRVTGTNLAREGIELVRAARDSNWAYIARQQNGEVSNATPGHWDCYVTTAAQATADPPGCTARFSTNAIAVNYKTYPNIGNGVPYFVQQGVAVTKNNVYLICQGQSPAPPVYAPATAAASGNPCGANGQGFYRRVTVQRGKDLGGGQYSLLVKSYVTWPDRKAGDLVIEEYLTDWRKFS